MPEQERQSLRSIVAGLVGLFFGGDVDAEADGSDGPGSPADDAVSLHPPPTQLSPQQLFKKAKGSSGSDDEAAAWGDGSGDDEGANAVLLASFWPPSAAASASRVRFFPDFDRSPAPPLEAAALARGSGAASPQDV
jgi:hypothetical protein